MQLSSATVDFYLFYDGHLDMQIEVLLTRSQCRVSVTQVSVKAHGPLIIVSLSCRIYCLNLIQGLCIMGIYLIL